MNRRRFLLMPLLAMISQRVMAFFRVSPSDQEGPFYPVVSIPLNADLVHHGNGAARGNHLELKGRVINQQQQPQSTVRVEIWQCDASGRYRHPWAPGNDRVDPHFAGFGSVNTGLNGAYRFKTLMPVPYGGRPPHIHVKLFYANRELLTSQLYLKGQVSQGGSRSGLSGAPEQMVIDPRSVGEHQWRADFDFVIT